MIKLRVESYKHKLDKFYYITVKDSYDDYLTNESIANELDMDYKKYCRILRKHGAFNKNYVGYCFHREGDAQMAIAALEPFIVMKTLRGINI